MSVYNYYGLSFNKIYWSRLVPLYIDANGFYKCCCCHKSPLQCKNKCLFM